MNTFDAMRDFFALLSDEESFIEFGSTNYPEFIECAVAHPTWSASIPPSPATRSNALVCRLMPGPASSLLGAHDSMHRVIVSSA